MDLNLLLIVQKMQGGEVFIARPDREKNTVYLEL
jgi:hypothetical protein